ncbi:MAG: hypothetical protein KF846_12115 [Cyclobacteriaceae bacterium]|nr:hypothetical protein [Cyclobacteriaceae bacterium]MBX2956896.1 hypothetical protein [Cyclobacteriaceae bacterium]
MKNRILPALLMVVGSIAAFGQNETAAPEKKWNFSADANFYFIPDDFFVLPVFKADKNRLHLEARYNYEDRETFSGWVGYNFMGGDAFEYTFTPMLGGVVGLSNGMAAGLEITLGYKGFELYSELENFFDPKTRNNDFFYMWTDITFAPKDWLWFGLSGQRTRLYQTDVELQKGLIVGAGLKNWELTTYVYNLGFDDPFLLLTLSVGF